jgi:hypothetical protein
MASTGDPTGLVRVDEGLSWVGNFTNGDHLINVDVLQPRFDRIFFRR